MTTYAEVQGTTLIKYSYGFAELQAENPYTNYDSNFDFVSIFPGTDMVVKNGYMLVPVQGTAPPSHDPTTQRVALNSAVLDGMRPEYPAGT